MPATSMASPAASRTGLPISRVIRAASSSRRSVTSSPIRPTTPARSSTGRRRHSWKAACALSTTPSTSLLSRKGNSFSVCPVAGLTVAYGRSPVVLAVLPAGAVSVVVTVCVPP
jgi:hypothetical protein